MKKATRKLSFESTKLRLLFVSNDRLVGVAGGATYIGGTCTPFPIVKR